MQKYLVFCVHGFLGEAADWSQVEEFLPESFFVRAHNYFYLQTDTVLRKAQLSHQEMMGCKKIFVGYSWGGRQGLQLLNSEPDLFDHYIFVSTHPGFQENDHVNRKLRVENDRLWAEKLKTLNRDDFLIEWNKQEVFKNTQPSLAQNKNLDLHLLKKALLQDSLGYQPDFRLLISNNSHKITWVVGSKDQKFLDIGQSLYQQKFIKNLETILSGHRILIDNPSELARIILRVAEKLN